MGYSIAAPIKNEDLKKKMLQFLKRYYKPWSKISENSSNRASCPIDELYYDHGKYRIGFNYGLLPDPERFYIYSVLTWIAIKVGKKKYFKKLGKSFLYYVYDGYKATPIIFEPTGYEEWDESIVDEYGFPKKAEMFSLQLGNHEKWKEMIRKELINLEEAWNMNL